MTRAWRSSTESTTRRCAGRAGDPPYDFGGACSSRGTEKLRGDDEYGVPLFDELSGGWPSSSPSSSSTFPTSRCWVRASAFASRAVCWRTASRTSADFRFDPPELQPFDLPSIGIVGKGKRVGKTAVPAMHALFAQDRDLSSSRWAAVGPPEPEVEPAVTHSRAPARASRDGARARRIPRDAVFGGVDAIGCRRCGGGLPAESATPTLRTERACSRARARPRHLRGSGAAFPPIATSHGVSSSPTRHRPELVAGYLNTYRVLVSDLVVLTGAEQGSRHDEIRAAIDE